MESSTIELNHVTPGLNITHTALSGGKVRAWIDLTPNGSPTAIDPDGHGSHVGGIVAGTGAGNAPAGTDLRGIAPEASLVGIRFPFGASPTAGSGILAALQRLVLNDFRKTHQIIAANLSLGSTARIRGEQDMVEAVVKAGIPVVVAAGNDFRKVRRRGEHGSPFVPLRRRVP